MQDIGIISVLEAEAKTYQGGNHLSDSRGDGGKICQEGGASHPGQEGHGLPDPDHLQGHGEGRDRGADAAGAGKYPGQAVTPGRGHHTAEQVTWIMGFRSET